MSQELLLDNPCSRLLAGQEIPKSALKECPAPDLMIVYIEIAEGRITGRAVFNPDGNPEEHDPDEDVVLFTVPNGAVIEDDWDDKEFLTPPPYNPGDLSDICNLN